MPPSSPSSPSERPDPADESSPGAGRELTALRRRLGYHLDIDLNDPTIPQCEQTVELFGPSSPFSGSRLGNLGADPQAV